MAADKTSTLSPLSQVTDDDRRTPHQFMEESVKRYLCWQYDRHFERYGRCPPETRSYAQALFFLNQPRQLCSSETPELDERLDRLLQEAIRQADAGEKKQAGRAKPAKREKRRA